MDSIFSCHYTVDFLSIHWLYFTVLWPFAYDASFVVNTHKSTLSTIPRVLLALLNFHFPCTSLRYVTSIISSHHDFNSCMLHFCFFRFNYCECVVHVTCVAIFDSHSLLSSLLTMRPFPCACTLIYLYLFYWVLI